MKLFISWSGSLSHKVATLLRDWLPSVIQSVTPYVSSEDIDKGARWSTDIAGELEDSEFGIICVTPENLKAPWVNFEAGALSKSIEKSKVCPFLFNVKRSEVHGPLLQFQSTVTEKDDVQKLLTTINGQIPDADRLKPTQLQKAFSVWWPELEQALSGLASHVSQPASAPAQSDLQNNVILEEVLELVRQQHRLLNDPESLVPSNYLRHAIQQDSRRSGRSTVTLGRRQTKWLIMIQHELDELAASDPAIRRLRERFIELHANLREQAGLRSLTVQSLPPIEEADQESNDEDG